MKKLTEKQWSAYRDRFSWMKLHRELSTIELQIIEKWLLNNTTEWWYFDTNGTNSYLYVFKNDSDMIAFKLWMSGRPFDNEYGEVDEEDLQNKKN